MQQRGSNLPIVLLLSFSIQPGVMTQLLHALVFGESYKSVKEAIVSNMTGSSVWHINLLSLAALVCQMLFTSQTHNGQFQIRCLSLCCTQELTLHKAEYWFFYLVDCPRPTTSIVNNAVCQSPSVPGWYLAFDQLSHHAGGEKQNG